MANFKDNPHININIDDLSNLMPKTLRKQVYCMHFDDENLPKKVMELGFNITKSQNFKKIKNL